jgi:3-oxoadipate CoA-transferase, beta subunit
LAVIDIHGGRFVLREKLPGLSADDLQNLSGARQHFERAVTNLTAQEL